MANFLILVYGHSYHEIPEPRPKIGFLLKGVYARGPLKYYVSMNLGIFEPTSPPNLGIFEWPLHKNMKLRQVGSGKPKLADATLCY